MQDIASVANGDTSHKNEIEKLLPQLRANGWEIADATHRIWAGERDGQALVAGLDANSALLVHRVLEIIAEAK